MKLLLFLVAALLYHSASAQFPYNPLPFQSANFKKVKEKGYNRLFVYEKTGDEKTLKWEVRYEKTGLPAGIWEKTYQESEDTVGGQDTLNQNIELFYYDTKGRLSRSTNDNLEDEGMGGSISAYTYNTAGKLVMKQTAEIDPPTWKYKYDASGKLKEVTITQKMPLHEDDEEEWSGKTFEKPAGRSVFKYDAKGRLAEEWSWMYDNKDPKPDSKIKWTYNAKNQLIKITRLDSEGVETSWETFEYNADGLVSAVTFKDDSETKKYIYKYCRNCKP